MAQHTFICQTCGHTCVDKSAKRKHVCPKDGTEMAWDLRGANICLDGDYNFVSQSMAINPDQAAEHRELFPDVEIKSDGCLGFNSVRQREKYMDTCGFHKPMSHA